MFCPKCGNPLAEQAAFCPHCGNAVNQQAPAEPIIPAEPEAPVYAAPVYTPPAYVPPVQTAPIDPNIKKGPFLATVAGPKTKTKANLVYVTGLITLLLIALSVYFILTGPLFDIPVLSLGVELADADVSELEDYIAEGYAEMNAAYLMGGDFMTPDQKAAIEPVLDALEDLNNTLSLQNLRTLLNMADDVSSALGVDTAGSEIAEAKLILDVVYVAAFVVFFLPVLFALLAMLLRSTGLTITALIFTFLSQLALSSPLLLLGTLVVYIIQAVLCSKVTGALRQYRNSGVTV